MQRILLCGVAVRRFTQQLKDEGSIPFQIRQNDDFHNISCLTLSIQDQVKNFSWSMDKAFNEMPYF